MRAPARHPATGAAANLSLLLLTLATWPAAAEDPSRPSAPSRPPVSVPRPLDPDPRFLAGLHARVATQLAHPAPSFYGPGPEVLLTPRFVYVRDRAAALPSPPWETPAAYAQ